MRQTCPECDAKSIYRYSKSISSGGGYSPDLLPKLGGTFQGAKMITVMCSRCGLIRTYADESARQKVEDSKHWERI